MKIKITNVEIRAIHTDEEYFADRERFGSTEYAEYMENREIGLAMSIESRSRLESSETAALLFGKAVHLCLQDPSAFSRFTEGKTLYTTPSGYAKNELGAKDYFLLSNFLNSFPLDLEAIKSSSDFYEKEVGYFLDITIYYPVLKNEIVIKFRCKPDLAFRLLLDPSLYIIDWKTSSKFGGYDFAKKYHHQGELYSNLMYLITGVDSFQHINYIFEKDHPYKQYDLPPNTFKITNENQQEFLMNALNMQFVMESHKRYIQKNAVISNDVLKCFTKCMNG